MSTTPPLKTNSSLKTDTLSALVGRPLSRRRCQVLAQHPREELGKGAVVKGENGEVTSGERCIVQGTQEQGVGVAQEQMDDVQRWVCYIWFCPSRALIASYFRAANGIRGGDDSEAKKKGLVDKVGEMRGGLTRPN